MATEDEELNEVAIQKLLLEVVLENDLDKIQELIKLELISPDYIYPDNDKTIFIIACSEIGVNTETIEELIKLGANIIEGRSNNYWEGIHHAASHHNSRTLEVLLKHSPESINALDANGNNALHLLLDKEDATEDILDCARILIKNGIFVNQKNFNNKTPLDMISKLKNNDDILEIRNMITESNTCNDKFELMKQYINENDQKKCIEEIEKITSWDQDGYIINSSTLLQLCCKKGLDQVVKYLLTKNVDAKQTTEMNEDEPILIAVFGKHWGILQLLLDKYYNEPSTLISLLIQFLIRTRIDCKTINFACKTVINRIKTFIKEGKQTSNNVRLKINEIHDGGTPLNYAVWFGTPDIVEELLILGAYPGVRTPYHDVLVTEMDFKTWRKHLNRCIELDPESVQGTPDFYVIFNFQSLLPPYSEINSKEDPEGNLDLSSKLIPESEVIYAMSKSPTLKNLLNHPIIIGFLYMKWQKYKYLFMINFIFILMFIITFGMYIIINYCEVVKDIKIHPGFTLPVYICLCIALLLLTIRELLQIFVDPKKYFKSTENYLDIALIGTAFLVITDDAFPWRNIKLQIWSVAIILLSFELIVFVGKHPSYSTKIHMLRVVTINFFSSFILYSIVIVAFSLSFHILFYSNIEKNKTAEKNEIFKNLGRTVFQTIVMLTGEFDSGSLDFDTFSVVSRVIFILFIFMGHLILLNLLNGLAVSDTNEIRGKAMIFANIARINYVRYMEYALKGDGLYGKLMKIVFKSERTLEKIKFAMYKNELLTCEGKFFTKLYLDEETFQKIYIILQNRRRSYFNEKQL